MPWTVWIYIAVPLTFCFIQVESQYNQMISLGNPNRGSRPTITNVISFQNRYNVNDPSQTTYIVLPLYKYGNIPTYELLPVHLSQTTNSPLRQFHVAMMPSRNTRNFQMPPRNPRNFPFMGTDNSEMSRNTGNFQMSSRNTGNFQMPSGNARNVQMPSRNARNVQMPSRNAGHFPFMDRDNSGGSRNTQNFQMPPRNDRNFPFMDRGNSERSRNTRNFQNDDNNSQFEPQEETNNNQDMYEDEDEEEDEDEVTWKDYFENSINWPNCETFVHGLSFVPKILKDKVFRDWAVEQGCQDAFFGIMFPFIASLFGLNYEEWKF